MIALKTSGVDQWVAEMPDAMELIFQTALALGKAGAVHKISVSTSCMNFLNC